MSLEFQHNVCGRSIYAEGTVDACCFLSRKMAAAAAGGGAGGKTVFSMADVLEEGEMQS